MTGREWGWRPAQAEGIWQQYLKLPEDNETWILRRYNKMLYHAFHSVEQGHLDDAIDLYNSQLQLIDTTQYSRLIYFTLIEKGKVNALKGDYRNAIADIHRAEKIAVDLGMKDCKLESYGLLARY